MISIFCTSSSCNFTFTNILNPWLEGKIIWFSWSTSSHGMCISRRKAKPIIESKGLSLKRVYFRSLAARCLSRSGARFAFDLIGKICKQLPSINALSFANSEFGFVFWNRLWVWFCFLKQEDENFSRIRVFSPFVPVTGKTHTRIVIWRVPDFPGILRKSPFGRGERSLGTHSLMIVQTWSLFLIEPP